MSQKIKVAVEECLLSDQQRQSVVSAAKEICEFMLSKRRKDGESIIGEVWPGLPCFRWEFKPVLELQPLDRVGGEPGKSGLSVLAGRFSFTARTKRNTIPSRQMIVKISPDPDKDPQFASEKRKELIDEWDAVKHHKQNFKDRKLFARPLWLHNPDQPKPAVLWAPFESPDDQYVLPAVGKRWKFPPVEEMVKYLSAAWASTNFQDSPESRKEKLREIMTAVECLSDAHSADVGGSRKPVNFVDHYDWELRGFMDKNGSKWAKKWHRLWKATSYVRDFGERWPNPIKVCEKLSKLGTRSLRMGCVHGDLHPRNIVFAEDGIRIIDFGWVRPQRPPRNSKDRGPEHEPQHIAKDFVLLEANLRFVTLPPFLPYESVKKFLGWIDSKRAPRKDIDDECRLRIDLIKGLRETARNHLGG